jgi:hypothetical protein
VRWDGRDASGGEAPSGLYFIRLVVEGHSQSRAVVRMR